MRKITLLITIALLTCTCMVYAVSLMGINIAPKSLKYRINSGYGTLVSQPLNMSKELLLMTMKWFKINNITPGPDRVYGSCILGNYVIFVGVADETFLSNISGSLGFAHIELRSRSSGNLVREWTDPRESIFMNCISVNGRIYVVGAEKESDNTVHWVIYVFDSKLHVLKKIVGEKGTATAIVTDYYRYIYVGGWIYVNNHFVLRIEKRNINNLTLVKSVNIYGSDWSCVNLYDDAIYDMAINPVTHQIWAVGHYKDVSDNYHGLIIILDKNLDILKEIETPYEAFFKGICFNNVGDAFVDGVIFCTVVLNKYGKILETSNSSGGWKIICTRRYVFEFDIPFGKGFIIYIINSSSMKLIEESYINMSYFFNIGIGKPSFDGSNIYVGLFANNSWALFSFNVLLNKSKVLECDFNCNGRLDVGDVVLLLRILVGEFHSNVPCDLNHNGRLDIGDAVLLLKKLVST
ncbi:MAG: hypothetical protein GXO10_01720 [Crenarchaeota archaeon]|nr:hypothetical protein [Thermoproteota archaeon]